MSVLVFSIRLFASRYYCWLTGCRCYAYNSNVVTHINYSMCDEQRFTIFRYRNYNII